MDQMKLRKALAMLQSLTDELPTRGDIEEKYVDLYHRLLTDIQDEIGEDMSYFSIPPSEVKHHETHYAASRRIGRMGGQPAHTKYSKERYCARAMFLMNLKGAINFINSLTPGAERRPIGFTQAE